MRTRRTGWGSLFAAPLLVAGLVACDPALPPPTLHVDSASHALDVEPGDGICLDWHGGCGLSAAVEEASALGGGRVVVPPGEYEELTATVAGNVTVVVDDSSDPSAVATVGRAVIAVDPGAALVVRGLDLGADEGGGVIVGGTLVADRTAFAGHVTVAPEGTAVLSGSFLGGGVVAVGRVHAAWSTFVASSSQPALGLEGGLVTLGATALLSGDGGPVCVAGDGAVAPTSSGPNLAGDGTCGLSGPDDVSGSSDDDGALFPSAGSPRVDAVPLGSLGCGTTLVSDIRGHVRPTDGDGDGVAACDIGAWERDLP